MGGRGSARRGPTALVVASLCAVLQPSACSTKLCDERSLAGLTVAVVDIGATLRICGAQVVATDGAYREVLTPSQGADGGEVDSADARCLYVGAAERPGTYALTASATGFRTATLQGVMVPSGACHVVPQGVTIQLAPSSQ